MKITLYYNESEKFVMNKTLNYIGEISGTLKQATSLLNPNIDLEMLTNGIIEYNIDVQYENNDISYIDDGEEFDVNIKMSTSIFECNYCYIEEFERFYFIDNIIIQNNKLFVLILSVDPLESHKEKILNQDAFITRNEFDYNPLVKDDEVSYYYDKDVIEEIADKGTMVNIDFDERLDIVSNNVFISVINTMSGGTSDSATPPVPSLPVVRQYNLMTETTSKLYVTDYTELLHLAKRCIQDDTIAEKILSVIAYPFTLKSTGNYFYLPIGDTVLIPTLTKQSVEVTKLANDVPQYLIVADFQINAESFLDYEPYTTYDIFLPFLSWVNLQADLILNNRIIVYYVLDYASGNADVNIYDVTNDKVIYTSSCQLGVKLGLTTTSQREVNDNRNANNTNLAIGTLSSIVAIVGGIASYNPVAVGGGAISLGKTIGSYVQNNNTNYLHASGNISSGNGGLYLPKDVKIRKTKLKPKNYNEDYFKLKGRPLNEYRNLSDLKGYTIVGEIHIENMKATKQEIEQIDTILKNGFIIG